MKKLALLTALCSLSMAVHSADWTPVFEGNSPIFLDKIWESVISQDNVVPAITHSAYFGDYSEIPMPYREDMLPVTMTVTPYTHEDGGVYITVPLKNATLYGLPISSITYYYINPSEAGHNVTFKPMSKSQYQSLERRVSRFEVEDSEMCGEFGIGLSEYIKGKEIILAPYGSC